MMLEKLPESVGHALSAVRAGAKELAVVNSELTGVNAVIKVSSPAFEYGAPIPAEYTADGEGLSPPLQWHGVPTDAKAVVILVEDADSPSVKPLVHAIVWDLPGIDASLPAGILSRKHQRADQASVPPPEAMGKNSFLQTTYLPPDPPPGHGAHRYAFQVFALNKQVRFDSPPGRSALLDGIRDHVIAKGLLLGTYER